MSVEPSGRFADQTQKSLSDVPGELDGLGDARELDRLDQPSQQVGSTLLDELSPE
jgi:hypothetical protein